MFPLCVNIPFWIFFPHFFSLSRNSLCLALGLFVHIFIMFPSEPLAAQPTWVGGHGVGDGSCLNDHKANVHMLQGGRNSGRGQLTVYLSPVPCSPPSFNATL